MQYTSGIYELFNWLPPFAMRIDDLHKLTPPPLFVKEEWAGKHPDWLWYSGEEIDFKDIKANGELMFNSTIPNSHSYYVVRQRRNKIILLNGSLFNNKSQEDTHKETIQLILGRIDECKACLINPTIDDEAIRQIRDYYANKFANMIGKSINQGSISNRFRSMTESTIAQDLFKMVDNNSINLLVIANINNIENDRKHMADQLHITEENIVTKKHPLCNSSYCLIYSKFYHMVK